MRPNPEVRVQIFFPLAGIATLGLLFGITATAQTNPAVPAAPAQAPANSTQHPASPAAAPAPTPAKSGPATVAAPTPEDEDKIKTIPGYAQEPPAAPQTVPPPQPGPAPVVTPDMPTPQQPYTAMPRYGQDDTKVPSDPDSGVYIPVDSWVYPAMTRLYSMGYLDTMYLGMRPYTTRSALHILRAAEDAILSSDDDEAQDLLAALLNELSVEGITEKDRRGTIYGIQSLYARVNGITGTILQDSFHLGQTYFNDYGRPEEPGFNLITGFSTVTEKGPFSLSVRAEYQHAPGAPGYSQSLASYLSAVDEITPYAAPNDPQATIPAGPIAAKNPFRLVEATLSYHILGHEISGGKSDAWLGPGMGGAMAWSNNAENIYSFRINRVEPLNIKYLSKLLGPVRYDFFYGSLKGHTYPNDDWVHSEMFSFRPTRDFEFGFQRTVVFGGKGHEPVTIHTFLKGFFDTNDTSFNEKYSRDDPGARFSAFQFSYRLPFFRRYLTLYSDSETHDDLTPVSAPRRASYRPGIYLSHFPMAKKLDLRVEGVSTDCSTLACQGGNPAYRETVQRQAYTNKGNILGDWIGREAIGGQAWLTYHLSANEWVSLQYLNKKTPNDFIVNGTTQNQFRVDVVKRFGPDIELKSWYMHEAWKAPVYLSGQQGNNTFSFQVTFFPKLKTVGP
jgi:hypothetical protein